MFCCYRICVCVCGVCVREYYITVVLCCLQLLQILPEGDGTMVGERGLQLSTSYQAKVTLARQVIYHYKIKTRQNYSLSCVTGKST
jgi:hypothetical protein